MQKQLEYPSNETQDKDRGGHYQQSHTQITLDKKIMFFFHNSSASLGYAQGKKWTHYLFFLALLWFCAMPCVAQSSSTYGTITSSAPANQCTATGCVYFQLPPDTPWVTLNIAGTWSGTLNVYSITSPDATPQNLNSMTWYSMAPLTANGSWSVATGNAVFILVQATAFASGSATVTMVSSQTGAPLSNPIFMGTGIFTGVTSAASISAPSINDVVYANPNAPGTTTAGINEALDSFGGTLGSLRGCGTIVLPAGPLTITTPIGGVHILGRYGCKIEGLGAQQWNVDGGSGKTTILDWAGSASSIGTISIDTGGSAYVRGDIVTVVSSGASGGTAYVDAVSSSGAVTGLVLDTVGTGYPASASGLATTGGAGSGLTVNISDAAPVVDLADVNQAFVSGFSINGGTSDPAGIGILLESETGGSSENQNFIQNVNIQDVSGTTALTNGSTTLAGLGVALYTANGANIDDDTLQSLNIGGVTTCFGMYGTNDLNAMTTGRNECGATTYGIDDQGQIFAHGWEFAGGPAFTVFHIGHQAQFKCDECYSEDFGTLFSDDAVSGQGDFPITFEDSSFNEPSSGTTNFGTYTQNGHLVLDRTALHSNVPGATLTIAPIGPAPSYDGTLVMQGGFAGGQAGNDLAITQSTTNAAPSFNLAQSNPAFLPSLDSSPFELHQIGGSPAASYTDRFLSGEPLHLSNSYMQMTSNGSQYFGWWPGAYGFGWQLGYYYWDPSVSTTTTQMLGGWDLGETPTYGSWSAYLINSVKGYQISASYGTAGQVMTSTGSGTQWAQPGVGSGTPTIACGTGAGTSPTVCSISGNQFAGQISVTTGTAPASSAVIATITLANACPTTVYAVARGSNAAAASLNGTTHEYPDGFTASSWTLTSNATGLAASTAYTWSYIAGCN